MLVTRNETGFALRLIPETRDDIVIIDAGHAEMCVGGPFEKSMGLGPEIKVGTELSGLVSAIAILGIDKIAQRTDPARNHRPLLSPETTDYELQSMFNKAKLLLGSLVMGA